MCENRALLLGTEESQQICSSRGGYQKNFTFVLQKEILRTGQIINHETSSGYYF